MQNQTTINRKMQNRQVSEFTLQDLFKVIFLKKWLILSLLVLTTGASIYYVKTTPPTYKANVVIMQEKTYDNILPVNIFSTRSYGYNNYGVDQGQLYVLKSSSSLQEISDQLLRQYDFNIPIMKLRSFINLASNNETPDVITLTASASLPEQTQAIANVAAEVFVKKVAEMKSAELSQGVDFLKQQMDQVEKKMHDTEKSLNDFREREGLVPQSSDIDSTGLLGKIGEMQNQTIQIENDIELNKSQLKTLEELIAEKKKYAQTSSVTGTSMQIDQLRERLINLQLELNTKLETQTEKDPEIIALRKRIEATDTQLKTEFNKLMKEPGTTSLDPVSELQGLTQQYVTLTVQLKGLESKGELIKERLKKFREEHPEIASKQVELIRLERQSRIFEQTYSTLAAKYQDVRLMEQMKGAGLKIMDKAYLPTSPVAPKKGMIITLAVLAGLFSGVMLSLFLEYISDTIKTKEDIERFLELPVLGTITQIGPFNVPVSAARRREPPAIIAGNRDNLTDMTKKQVKHETRHKSDKEILNMLSHSLVYAPNGNSKSPAVENYWNLAMSIKYANMDNPLKSILVTSSIPGERKTTTAGNLAIVKARLGMKVLLIDADLRRPMLHRIFQQNRKPGLSDLLTVDDATNGKTFDFVTHDSIRPTVLENLYLLPCGSSVPNSDALLSSDRMRELLDALKEKFDLVIIDSAPLLVVASVVALSKEVDGVLLSMYAGKTRRKLVNHGKEILESVNAKIIGSVLTGVDFARQYGYYYRRYYKYYYQHKDDNE